MAGYLVVDIATAPIAGAAEFLEEPAAPANYRDPEKIAAYVAEKKAEQLQRLALDPDLGRIAAIGYWLPDRPLIKLCKTEEDEREALVDLSRFVDARTRQYSALVGYNSLKFDWPFLMRRARYLGVSLEINLDRYKTPHVDLAERLTHRGLLQMRSLSFYVKRLGWTDLHKTLSGAEEALAPELGQWVELEESVVHDVTATQRLAEWLGVIPRAEVEAVGF